MGMTLVTGASGFVGSHLMKDMTRRGLPVRGVTRGITPGLTTIRPYSPEMDWSNYLEGVDTVVHLAARVHVMRETASDPLSLFREANVTPTVNLARQSAEAGVRRFVFVSSIKVNGERTEPGKPFTADDPPNPQDAYGISKAEAESALFEIGRETSMEITIIRPPLVYGPCVRGNFRSLIKWAASGIPSFLGAIKNKRSVIYIENLCDLLITVLNHPRAANQIFLAGDHSSVSSHTLLCGLASAIGRKQLSVPLPEAVLKAAGAAIGKRAIVERLLGNLEASTEATCEALSWSPPIDFMTGLRRTVANDSQATSPR